MRQNAFKSAESSCALVRPARRSWIARAAKTLDLTCSLDSGVGPSYCNKKDFGRFTSTCRSILSNSGPDILPRYLLTCSALQLHRPLSSPRWPQGQGFIAATSCKRAGEGFVTTSAADYELTTGHIY
jgi:hypothetical protein